jgi:hypothetical protein
MKLQKPFESVHRRLDNLFDTHERLLSSHEQLFNSHEQLLNEFASLRSQGEDGVSNNPPAAAAAAVQQQQGTFYLGRKFGLLSFFLLTFIFSIIKM